VGLHQGWEGARDESSETGRAGAPNQPRAGHGVVKIRVEYAEMNREVQTKISGSETRLAALK
jgi:hypothetical protein